MMPTTPATMPPSRLLQWALLAAAATFVLVQAIGVLWSGSVDLAHHYALAARLAETWSLPPGPDPALGEMSVYPRTSHGMAAILGAPFDSTLVGLQLVGLLSIVALWAAFIHLLQTLPGRWATRALLVFGGLLVLNRLELKFELHGRELVGNYFFAQLVAQAVAALALVGLSAMERRGVGAATRYVVAVAIVYFCTGVHVLPALELLGAFVVLVALDVLARWREPVGRLPRAWVGLAFVLGASALLVRHPSFAAMAEISRNNGALSPKHLDSIGVIGVYAVVLALSSAQILRRWFGARRDQAGGDLLALKYLGAFGLAVAGLCLVQILALQFGHGSEYAVKKHVFALNTVALLELSLLPALLGLRRAPVPPAMARGFFATYLLLPLLVVMAFYGIAPRKASGDLAPLVALERSLQQHRDELVGAEPGRFAYVVPGPGVSPAMAYLFTIGVFHTPRGHGSNAFSILQGQAIADWPAVGTVVQPGGAGRAQVSECLRSFPGASYSVLDGKCLGRAAERAATLIPFTAGPLPLPCTLQGFGAPEAWFTWTVESQATIDCPVPAIDGRPARRVVLSAGAFLEKVPLQRARVSVDGGGAAELRFDAAHSYQAVTLDLPADATRVRLRLELPDAISPKDVGLSIDPRRLGLSVARIEFQ